MMRNILKSTCIFVLLSLIAMPVAAQEIVPFTDYLPADTFAVISIPQMSEFKAFIEQPQIKQLIDLFLNKSEFAEGFAEFKQEFLSHTGFAPEEFYNRLDGDMTIAMLSFPIARETPDMVVMIGLKGGPEALASDLDRMVASASKEEGKEAELINVNGHRVYKIEDDAFFSDAGGHFMIASSVAALEQFFSDSPRLNTTAGFSRHQELVGLNEGVSVYVNFDSLNKILQMSMESKEDESAHMAAFFMEEFGLDKINGISLTIPFMPGSARMFIHAPGYDGVIAKIFSPAPVDRGIVSSLASNTDSLGALSLQKPDVIMDYVIELISRINPGMTAQMFEVQLEQFRMQSGVDLRNDLLGSIGTNLAFSVHLKEDADLDFTENPYNFFKSFEIDMLWQLQNREAFERAMNVLLGLAAGTMPDALSTEEYKGSTIHSLAWGLPGASLSMSIHDGYMRFATRDTAAMKALIDELSEGLSAASSSGFQQAMQKIPAGANMFSYVSADYYRKFIQLSLDMMPGDAAYVSDEMREFLDVLRDGAMKAANRGRSYSGFALPMDDGFYGEGEVNPPDQIYLFMIEMTKYFYFSHVEEMEQAN